jgi:hypothetical protein
MPDRAAQGEGGGALVPASRPPARALRPRAQEPLDRLVEEHDDDHEDDHPRSEQGRDQGQAKRRTTGEEPEPEAKPADRERSHVHDVFQELQAHHPRRHVRGRHPGRAQRPYREGDTAGARGGEHLGGRPAGEHDLGARTPADRVAGP